MKEIEQNIIDTIKRLKKDGITGMSLENLRQITPTKNVNVYVGMYGRMFKEAARTVCMAKNFKLY